jgi:hypothetical protein
VAEGFCSGETTTELPHEIRDPLGPERSHLVPAITRHNWGRHRLAHSPHAGPGPPRLITPITTRSGLAHKRDRSLAWRPRQPPRAPEIDHILCCLVRKGAQERQPGRAQRLALRGAMRPAPLQPGGAGPKSRRLAGMAETFNRPPLCTVLDHPSEPAHQRSISRSASTQPDIETTNQTYRRRPRPPRPSMPGGHPHGATRTM